MSELALAGGEPVRRSPYPPWPDAGPEELEALRRVLESGNWDCRYGDEVSGFERRFADYQDAAHGICVTSGEAALRLPLLALGLEPGSEVILPAYTFVATATVVLDVGAVPVFADVESGSYTLDPAAVAELVGERTAAIMPVHIGGVPAAMEPLLEIAAAHGLAVLEDAAQAWGARYRGRGVGALGTAGGFSFHASKNLTCGEGGIVLTDDDELAERCRSLGNNGRAAAGDRYRHVLAGGNYRMTEFQGALLGVGLDRYPGEHARRAANAEAVRRALAEVPGVGVQELPDGVEACGWHLLVLRLEAGAFGGADKGTLVRALVAEGIPASPGYDAPAYGQPLFAERPFRRGECPVAERACAGEAVWVRHNALMGEVDDALDVARALDKLSGDPDALRRLAAEAGSPR